MPEVICPFCDSRVTVPPDKGYFQARLACPECRVPLRVINEKPLRVERFSGGGGRGWIADWVATADVKRPARRAKVE